MLFELFLFFSLSAFSFLFWMRSQDVRERFVVNIKEDMISMESIHQNARAQRQCLTGGF